MRSHNNRFLKPFLKIGLRFTNGVLFQIEMYMPKVVVIILSANKKGIKTKTGCLAFIPLLKFLLI